MIKLKELRVVLHRIDSTKKKRSPEPAIKNLTHLKKKDPVLTRPANPPSGKVAFHLYPTILGSIKREANDSISSEGIDDNIYPPWHFESAINQQSGRSEILKSITQPNYSDIVTLNKKTENVAGNSYTHSVNVAVGPTRIKTLNNNGRWTIVQNTSKITERSMSSGIKDTLNLSTYFCRICNANFNYISTESINEHKDIHAMQCDEYRRETHTGEFPYVCHVCGTKFQQKRQLNDHIETHTAKSVRTELPKSSETCFIHHTSSTQSKNQDQTRKMNELHVTVTKSLCSCKYCDQTFENTCTLKRHVEMSHTGDKKFKCQLCDKKFTRKHGLVKHNRSTAHNDHTSELPYICNVNLKPKLRNHIKTAADRSAKSVTTGLVTSNGTCYEHQTPTSCQKTKPTIFQNGISAYFDLSDTRSSLTFSPNLDEIPALPIFPNLNGTAIISYDQTEAHLQKSSGYISKSNGMCYEHQTPPSCKKTKPTIFQNGISVCFDGSDAPSSTFSTNSNEIPALSILPNLNGTATSNDQIEAPLPKSDGYISRSNGMCDEHQTPPSCQKTNRSGTRKYCDEQFDTNDNLRQHVEGIGPNNVRKTRKTCDICDKEFSTIANWKRHHKIHNQETDFECLNCERRFIRKSHLDLHVMKNHNTICNQNDGLKSRNQISIGQDEIENQQNDDGISVCNYQLEARPTSSNGISEGPCQFEERPAILPNWFRNQIEKTIIFRNEMSAYVGALSTLTFTPSSNGIPALHGQPIFQNLEATAMNYDRTEACQPNSDGYSSRDNQCEGRSNSLPVSRGLPSAGSKLRPTVVQYLHGISPIFNQHETCPDQTPNLNRIAALDQQKRFRTLLPKSNGIPPNLNRVYTNYGQLENRSNILPMNGIHPTLSSEVFNRSFQNGAERTCTICLLIFNSGEDRLSHDIAYHSSAERWWPKPLPNYPSTPPIGQSENGLFLIVPLTVVGANNVPLNMH